MIGYTFSVQQKLTKLYEKALYILFYRVEIYVFTQKAKTVNFELGIPWFTFWPITQKLRDLGFSNKDHNTPRNILHIHENFDPCISNSLGGVWERTDRQTDRQSPLCNYWYRLIYKWYVHACDHMHIYSTALSGLQDKISLLAFVWPKIYIVRKHEMSRFSWLLFIFLKN